MSNDSESFYELAAKIAVPQTKPQSNFANPPKQGGGKAFYKSHQWKLLRDEMFALNEGNVCRSRYHEGSRTVAKVELDHVIELDEGGTNDRSNLVFRCPTCHRRKTARAQKRRFLKEQLGYVPAHMKPEYD